MGFDRWQEVKEENKAMIQKMCGSCGRCFYQYNKLQTVCGSCIYLSYRNKKIKRKPLKRIGKIGRQWIATRNEWINKNLPDSGKWKCHYCHVELTMNHLTLDHKHSRSRKPELRFELDNLVPCCIGCNLLKGSLNEDEFIKKGLQ